MAGLTPVESLLALLAVLLMFGTALLTWRQSPRSRPFRTGRPATVLPAPPTGDYVPGEAPEPSHLNNAPTRATATVPAEPPAAEISHTEQHAELRRDGAE